MVAVRMQGRGFGAGLRIAGEEEIRPAGIRRAMSLEALPVGAVRIEPSLSLDVNEMSHTGLAARSRRPLEPGQLLALGFPASPFLPPPGTVARVSGCVRTAGGWQLELSYSPNRAA